MLRTTLLPLLLLACLAVGASVAHAQPIVLPHPTFKAGKFAALHVAAPSGSRSCVMVFRATRRTVMRRHVTLGGPTRLVRWRVGASARGTWRATLTCYGRGGKNLGAAWTIVDVHRKGRPNGRLMQHGSVRMRHGSIPEMAPPRATSALDNPLSDNDVAINACAGGAVVGCFNPCANSEQIKSTRTTGNGPGTAAQMEPTTTARANAGANSASLRYSDAALKEDYNLYRSMWKDLNRCGHLPSDLSSG